MRGAIYARYSGDRQRETSIDDQVRNCTRHAEREGIASVRVYHDKAITGAVKARPGYQEMLSDAAADAFDVLLVDDLSRLSRDDYEMKGVLRRFAWQGLRVIGVTDGYDSTRKGHKIHAGFKGLMNELFLDDLRERTHRGMVGQALKGYNCGGRTYGYRNVPIEDETRKDAYGRPSVIAVRYEIDEAQAAIVRQIHAWYAAGYSYKWIAVELNRRKVPSSRGGSWAVSAVKVVLENEMYEGRLTWNRRTWMKHPDTGKRTYRNRPRDEWVVRENPDLRIVDAGTIDAVRRRQKGNRESGQGQFQAASAQRYLLSGLMACATCGGNFVMVSAGRYGCAAHKTRGPQVCGNGVTVTRHIVEDAVLRDIKDRLMEPDNVEKFKRAALRVIEAQNASDKAAQIGRSLRTAERVRENVLVAIKQGIITPGTKEALEKAEAEVADLKRQIAHAEQWQVSGILPRAVERYEQAVAQLKTKLEERVEPAREILKTLLGERIRIHRRGEILEAEIPNHVRAILAKSLNDRNDSFGCGGDDCNKSHFVPLVARRSGGHAHAGRPKYQTKTSA